MGKWCPLCRAEYVEGWGTCSNCGVELVATLPPESEERRPDVPFEARPPREVEDPFIPIWEGPTTEGVRLARRLEAAVIPVEIGEAAEPGRMRLEVPRSYISEAYTALDEPDQGFVFPQTDDDDEDWEHEPGGGIPTNIRVAFAIMAIVLIIALVLTSR